MYHHRKRLIAKRLTKLMKKKNDKYMKQLFEKFIQSRAKQFAQLVPQQQQQSIIEEQESIEEEEIIEEDQIIEEDEEEVRDLTLADYISTLSPQEKRAFKQENPELPETFFMSKKEKEKYFARKNNKFQNDLKHTPKRTSKNGNHVQFKNEFHYKPFSEHQKPLDIKKAKEFHQNYDNKIHFS